MRAALPKRVAVIGDMLTATFGKSVGRSRAHAFRAPGRGRQIEGGRGSPGIWAWRALWACVSWLRLGYARCNSRDVSLAPAGEMRAAFAASLDTAEVRSAPRRPSSSQPVADNGVLQLAVALPVLPCCRATLTTGTARQSLRALNRLAAASPQTALRGWCAGLGERGSGRAHPQDAGRTAGSLPLPRQRAHHVVLMRQRRAVAKGEQRAHDVFVRVSRRRRSQWTTWRPSSAGSI